MPIQSSAGEGFVIILDEKHNDYYIYDTENSESNLQPSVFAIQEQNNDYNVMIPLTSGNKLNSNAKVDYVIEHITTTDNDLVVKSGTHFFKNGSELPVLIKSDNINEKTQQFKISFSNPLLIDIVNNEVVYSIQDDDTVPNLSISNIDSIFEGENITFSLSLDSISEQDISVDYNLSNQSTTNNDHSNQSGKITIPAGQTEATVVISTNDDSVDENNEIFKFNLVNNVNVSLNENQKDITIQDNDVMPSLSIADASIVEVDTNTNTLNFEITLSEVSEKNITVDFSTLSGTAVAGDDFVQIDQKIISFAPLEKTKQVSVLINGDYEFEGHETFTGQLSNVNNATISKNTAIGTINNNDVIYEFNKLPLYGIVEYNDGNGWKQVVENTNYSRDYDFRYNPTEEDVLAVSRDINIGSFDTNPATPYYVDGNHSLSDWGSISGSKATYSENGVTVTTKLKNGTLSFLNSPGTHIGVGIGSTASSGHLTKTEEVEITLDGDFLNDVKLTADGLGSCYDLNNGCETKIEIKAYDFNNNLIDTQGGYRKSTTTEFGEAFVSEYFFTGSTAIKRFVVKTIPTNIGGNNTNLSSGSNSLLNMTISRSAFEVMDYKKIDVNGDEVTETLKLNINEGNANTNVDLNNKLEQ